jgi:predicted transcriptional regulator
VVKRALPGGDLEYAILSAVLDMGSATVREIHARVGEPESLAYTTTATVLDRLFAKRLVGRRLVGKSFTYSARIKRADLERRRTKTMLEHLVGAAPVPAMANLVDAVEAIDPKLLDELARALEARRRSRGGA